jgi:hypothetical protein
MEKNYHWENCGAQAIREEVFAAFAANRFERRFQREADRKPEKARGVRRARSREGAWRGGRPAKRPFAKRAKFSGFAPWPKERPRMAGKRKKSSAREAEPVR